MVPREKENLEKRKPRDPLDGWSKQSPQRTYFFQDPSRELVSGTALGSLLAQG